MRALLPVFVVGLVACGSDPTAIRVEIHGADDVLAETTTVRIRVEGRALTEPFPEIPLYATDVAVPAGADDFPLTHYITPLDGDATRSYRVTAQALASRATGPEIVSETRAISGFVAGETRVLHLFLPGGPCLMQTCAATDTCVQGECEELVPIPAEDLPRSVGTFDAGADAGAFDAGPNCEGEGDPCTEGLAACEEGVIRCGVDGPECVGAGPVTDGRECRASSGELCDAPEACDGVSVECPLDAPAPDGTSCGDTMVCLDGSCVECTAGEACEVPDMPCARGRLRCTPDGAVCEVDDSDPFLPSGTTCREAVGLCDVADVCDGTSAECPALFVEAGVTCRMGEGCDAPEVCSGASPNCPVDEVQPAGFECAPSEGACQIAGLCDGLSSECPGARIRSAGAECRSPAGECDAPEVCDGASVDCPSDLDRPFGAMCGDGDICDGMGSCVEANCGAPCTPGPCATGTIVCAAGAAPTCGNITFRPATHTCRPAMGLCDVAESCTGSSVDCPANTFVAAGTECREAAGDCDLPESCSGSGASCPTDVRVAPGMVCRAAAGVCDVAETCNGGTTCPANGFATGGVCRVASGACDVAESCNGTSAGCPPDGVRAAGFECRAAVGGCAEAEVCDGSDKDCPRDLHSPPSRICRASMNACDARETCTGGSPDCPGDVATCDDLRISEVLPGNNGFVELYNRGDSAVRVTTCSLDLDGFPYGNMMGAPAMPVGGFFLFGHGVASPEPDEDVTNVPSGFGGQIVLWCDGELVDAVAWGTGGDSEETFPPDGGGGPDGGPGEGGMGVALEPPALPGFSMFTPSDSFERKHVTGSRAVDLAPGGSHVSLGNQFDMDTNETDFVIQRAPVPQNTRSAAEPNPFPP